MKPTKEELYEMYVRNKMSIRDIMDKTGYRSNRGISKLLKEMGVLRKGSKAIKVQWENNPERREKQANFAKERFKNNKQRRLPIEDLKERFYNKNLILKERKIENGYSIIEYVCRVCGYKGETSLKNDNGCPKCAQEKRARKQRIDFEIVQKDFAKAGLILLEDNYKGNNQTLAFICPRHKDVGVQYRTYSSLKHKNLEGCQYCTYDDMAKEGTNPRKSWKYSEWRKGVFERDNYTCQKCGDDSGGNLEAHHIQNFAENEDIRFDVTNGITLCEKCHNPTSKGSFHDLYGTKNNNYEQLENFLA